MQFDLPRAHRRFLPLVGQRRRRSDQEAAPLETVRVDTPVKTFLVNALAAEGAYRGGPLFGQRETEILQIHHAHTCGYSRQAAYDPLTLDADYLLGLTDAHRQHDAANDWVGHWITWPDSQLPSEREMLLWCDVAHDLQLVSTEHVLLMVGWTDGLFDAAACMTGEKREDCEWVRLDL